MPRRRGDMRLSDFHTHTAFCDGRDAPEEMVKAALEKGFFAFGTSAHNFIAHDPPSSMRRESIPGYKAEMKRLKEKYSGQIDVFCGTEQEFFATEPTDGYDYVIGSVHYVKAGERYITVDRSPEHLRCGIDECFSGDAIAFCEAFFENEGAVAERTGCDIIGHFDLVEKYNEGNCFFDPSSPRYVRAYERAIERLIPSGCLFEVNTGVISRGYRDRPYPSEAILNTVREAGGRVILSSDAHRKENVGFGFDDALRLLEKCGFDGVAATPFESGRHKETK